MKQSLRQFIRDTFANAGNFTATDVTKAAKAAGLPIRGHAATDALYHMNGLMGLRRVHNAEKASKHGWSRFGGQSVARRIYTFTKETA